ncbi:MAG: dihydropyrimidinase [Planctomycetota bacterium]|nr:MAG: dihydropyrimidinase [Planctomycetota bacterium]
MGLLIRGGDVVTTEGVFRADVYADDDGIIRQVGRDLEPASSSDRVVDAGGQLVLPGAIDPHTHVALPFMGTVSCDDWFDATAAGCVGGTTTIFDFVIGSRGERPLETLEAWMAKAEGKAVSDYAYHMAVIEWNDDVEREIPEVVARGIPSFKAFTAYKGALMLEDEELFKAMRAIAAAGGILTIHAVNGAVLNALAEAFAAEGRLGTDVHHLCQPPESEGEATHRAIRLAGLAGLPLYVVHVTCDAALKEIQEANKRGQEVYCETCIQYLLLDDSLYSLPDFEGAKYVASPPLRKPSDQEALWQGIARRTVHTLGTDHAPFHFETQKVMGKDDFRKIPNGMPGVEERLSLLYTYGVETGRITLPQLVEVCCTAPARIFGIDDRKGAIRPGADADIVLYDPHWEGTFSVKTQRSTTDYNCYEGWKRKGRPTQVFVRGRQVVRDSAFCGEPGFGRHLARKPRRR